MLARLKAQNSFLQSISCSVIEPFCHYCYIHFWEFWEKVSVWVPPSPHSLIFSSHTLHSSLTGLFPITQTGQTHSCLGGFALADPSAGNIFTPNICRVFSHLRVFAQMSTIVSLTLTILFKLAVYAPCPTIPIFFLYFIFWHIFPFHTTYCLIMCYLICIAYQWFLSNQNVSTLVQSSFLVHW